ncbi:H K ATPase alpha [Cordyceps militaris]|uniref:H K ATPase alpha n=1 Tax=Cordyceps militaris TaxID=73501 RepID=A0A2H4S9R9_CORMI|nr:H K ATPase alpha [Cordyceps militaris]
MVLRSTGAAPRRRPIYASLVVVALLNGRCADVMCLSVAATRDAVQFPVKQQLEAMNQLQTDTSLLWHASQDMLCRRTTHSNIFVYTPSGKEAHAHSHTQATLGLLQPASQRQRRMFLIKTNLEKWIPPVYHRSEESPS